MLVASVRLGLDAVALRETFERVPDLDVEVERNAAHGTGATMPCLWASGVDYDDLDAALAADATVDGVVEGSEFATAKYYRVDWSGAVERRLDAFVDHEASILRAAADADGWRLRFRFVTREQFDAFRRFLADRGDSFTLLDLAETDAPRRWSGDLTPAQREALMVANEQGYFEVPRALTTRELAAELSVSHQALSERLRRATGSLVDSTLARPADVDDT